MRAADVDARLRVCDSAAEALEQLAG